MPHPPTHRLTHPPPEQANHHECAAAVQQYTYSSKQMRLVRTRDGISTLPPGTNHVCTPTTHPLPANLPTTAARTAVSPYARSFWLVLESRGPGQKRGEFRFFTTVRHLGERASRHPPSTHHPPPTHRPTRHSSTTAVQQYVPTNPQRQHSRAAARTTAVHLVREERDGDFHVFAILHLPGERATRPREGLLTLPARRAGSRRPFCRRGHRGLMREAGVRVCGRWGPGGQR